MIDENIPRGEEGYYRNFAKFGIYYIVTTMYINTYRVGRDYEQILV